MTLHRCFAWARRAGPVEPDGPLWFPRVFQGEGRHDNPDVYGCLYLADREVSAVVEQLARFRGQPLLASMLLRRGRPLALAAIELRDGGELVDLDDPAVLSANGLRPSLVATRARAVTQPQALALHGRGAIGLRWWSTFESLWANTTIFDRAAPLLRVQAVRALAEDDVAVQQAAEFLGLGQSRRS